MSNSDTFSHHTVTLLGGGRVSVAAGTPVDERIRMVTERQRGKASRAQLLAAGIRPGAVTRRLRSGSLERVHFGVYSLAGTADIPLGAEAAALLACGEGAALSHHSAMTLWGLRPGVARPVHVTIPADRGFPAPPGVIVHRSRTLTSADVTTHDGLPVTSVARAFLDVAATLPDRDVERLLDEGMFVRRLVTMSQLDAVLARAGGHPGRSRLSRVASRHTRSTRTESPPQETLFRLVLAAGLPEPETEFPMLDYRLDLFWPQLRLAVEVDGVTAHGSRARFESDRRRDARLLTERGIATIRLTRAAVEERPLEAVGTIARAIGQREAR